jgi:mannosylglucosylglycerate synthase
MRSLNIGFISTRLAGTDGVSLEVEKWAEVLEEQMGHTCFYFAGLIEGRPENRCMLVPQAFYRDPEIKARHDLFWASQVRKEEDTQWIHGLRDYFRGRLRTFIQRFDLDLLIAENALSIPLNIPLGLALTEVIAETGIPVLGHHHDFAWERDRFLVNSVQDYISMAFPPNLPSIHHIVINTMARHQLARRAGVGSAVIPNVMNFEEPAPGIDHYSEDLRKTLGMGPNEVLVLQPTRVVQRKGIEHAIELVNRLEMNARLVISHASGDEGDAYELRIRNYAELLGVQTVFASNLFAEKRSVTADGYKVYSLWDAYPHADLVTYPSLIEGFGNAFLEALYFRKPIVVNNYAIYAIDIKTKGFTVIEFDSFITQETVNRARQVIEDRELADRICEQNYRLALQHFSYTTLRHKLQVQLDNCFGTRS